MDHPLPRLTRYAPAPEPWVRAGAFAGAVILNAWLILLNGSPRLPDRSPERVATLRFIELTPPTAAAPDNEVPPVRTVAPSPSPAPQTSAERALQTPATRSQGPAPLVDWKGAAERSATAAVEEMIRKEGYRRLGPSESFGKIDTKRKKKDPTVFDQPKRKTGDVAEDWSDTPSVWHNENCYTRLEEPITPRPSADIPGVNLMRCMWKGRRKPRGDLFEHLYEPPQPPAELRTMDELPERLPEPSVPRAPTPGASTPPAEPRE